MQGITPMAVRALRRTQKLIAHRGVVRKRSLQSIALKPFGGEVASALVSQGFAVFDNALAPEFLGPLREEIDLLDSRGALRSNATHFVSPSGGTVELRKKGVHEAEVHTLSDALRALTPGLVSLEQDGTACALLSVLHPRLTLRGQSVKAVLGVGDGACFPLHVDSAQSVDARLVTALLYLNDDWDIARDGGALRVYPFPAAPVDIAPAPGRLVLLSALHLLHRVLPARARRYSLTIWLSGSYRAPPEQAAAGADEEARLCAALLAPKVRPLVARVALAEEWDQSIRDAHAPAEAEAALDRHARDRATITARLPAQVAATVAGGGPREHAVEERVRSLLSRPAELLSLLREHSAANGRRWL